MSITNETGETPSKRSKIEKETNYNVLANFVILLAMCIACGIANGLFLNKDDTSARSYEKGVNPAANNIVNAVVTFGYGLSAFSLHCTRGKRKLIDISHIFILIVLV